MVETPHFKTPFRILGSQVAVIEQDSDDDILACVETVLRTPAGSRIENPEYGLTDPTFQSDPAAIENECQDAIEEWEPRATAVPEAEISNRIAAVRVGVTT